MTTKTLLAAAALFGSATLAGAQTTIGASGTWSVNPFGAAHNFGQTFTVPTNGDDRLDAFSFWMSAPFGSGTELRYRGYVFAWDATAGMPAGPALFTSAIHAAPSTTPGFHQATVATGGVPLAGGGMYVAFLSTVGTESGGANAWQYVHPSAYDGGRFVYQTNVGTTAGFTTEPWRDLGDADAEFEMQFGAGQVSAVPEPAAVVLSATGLLALGGLGALRRRRASQQG